MPSQIAKVSQYRISAKSAKAIYGGVPLRHDRMKVELRSLRKMEPEYELSG